LTNSSFLTNVQLFEVFWAQITELIKARPEFSLDDTIGLLLSLSGLSLNCYPERLDYVDLVFGMAKDSIDKINQDNSESIYDGHSVPLLLQLLLGPIATYADDLMSFLKFPSSCNSQILNIKKSANLGGNFTDLLFLQPYSTRRQVAHVFISTALKACRDNKFNITSVEGVTFVLGEVASIMVRDQIDGGLFGSIPIKIGENEIVSPNEPQLTLDFEDASEEQIMIAKFIHVIQKTQTQDSFKLLIAARDHLLQVS
jgi:vacuolar protein sorting-associated protein 35